MPVWLFLLWYRCFPPRISASDREVVEAYSSYYRRLDPPNQTRFEWRLAVQLKWIHVHAEDLPEVTREMQIAIGSALVQITFGLPEFLPRRFRHFHLAPRAYRYQFYDEWLVGDTNFEQGIVSLSWPHVQQGFQIDDDGHNVTLHEIAHCLEAEHVSRLPWGGLFNRRLWRKWRMLGEPLLPKVADKEVPFMKSSGGKNLLELFAVCIEAFFERPDDLKRELPEVFDHLVLLLRQDPRQRGNPRIR